MISRKTRRTGRPLDRLIQRLYRLAFGLLKAYWFVARPHTRGANVAVWHGGRLLIVWNSYLKGYSLPGGFIRRNEPSSIAAARELKEEVGISVRPEDLTLAIEYATETNYHNSHTSVFEIELDREPEIFIDHREIVSAEFMRPKDLKTMKPQPALLPYFEARLPPSATSD
ncbi:MAG: NUDIX hydrolase [Alphaproteobacteria bacterium]